MAKGKSHHVVPHKDGWAVKKAGSEKPSRVVPTKSEAKKVGRDISSNQGTELIIHGENGKIQSRDSHGKDPHPPKG